MATIRKIGLSLALATGLATAAPAEVVMLGSVADFNPYNYLDDDGELRGFESELATLICTRAGLTCEWALEPWENLIDALLEDEFDVILSVLQITAENEVIIDFTEEYFPADPSAIIAREGEGLPLAGSIVGAQADSLQAGYVTEQDWTLSAFETPEEGIEALKNGTISAFVADQAYLQTSVDQTPDLLDFVATEVVIGGGIGMAVRETDPSLLSQLNAALAALKADGTLDTLIGSWFDGRDPGYRTAL